MTVGVGMPVAIQFDTAVQTKEMRPGRETRHRHHRARRRGQLGWLDNRQLMWRPKDFWAPGTKVTVSAPLAGVQTGDTKWVGKDESGGFTIGDAMISHVDVPGHTMTVTRNGQVIRTIPVSNGPRSRNRDAERHQGHHRAAVRDHHGLGDGRYPRGIAWLLQGRDQVEPAGDVDR